ncbi:MAG: hypothetical protein ABRQ38_08530 [Candidatus Eremiobacterota bacterium]
MKKIILKIIGRRSLFSCMFIYKILFQRVKPWIFCNRSTAVIALTARF